MSSDGIIIETKRIANVLRVTAIDPITGTEVVFQAPATTDRASLQRLALSKIRYVCSKK